MRLQAEIEECKRQKLVAANTMQKLQKSGQQQQTSGIGGLIDISGKILNADAANARNLQKQTPKKIEKIEVEPERPIEQFHKKLKAVFAENVFLNFTLIFQTDNLGNLQRAASKSTTLARKVSNASA